MKNRKYKGVQVRGDRIRIYFNYAGERRFQPVDGKPVPETLEHYERLVEIIEYEIKAGTFVYQSHFGNSLAERRFGTFVTAWLETKKLEIAKSSYRAYESRCDNWVLPRWADIDAEEINYRAIQSWTQKALMPNLTNKTVRLSDPAEVDPFTRAEIKKILTANADPQIINLVAFMMWSGARISEAIALAWEDVDLAKGVITIKRARVASTYKITKTRRSTRKVKLLRPAIDALIAQHALTGSMPPVKASIIQRDNRTTRESRLRFCFHNPNTNLAFSTADNMRNSFWNALIKETGLRHRGPNQCRHTFASQMLSSGAVTVDWVANQLGHTSTQMIWRHYGKWIPEDEANIIGLLEDALDL